MARARRNNEAIGRIHWVLVSRLIVFLCLLGAILIFLRDRGILLSLLSLYGVGTLIYLVALLSNRLRRSFPISLLLGFQLAFEVFLEAGIVHFFYTQEYSQVTAVLPLLHQFRVLNDNVGAGLHGEELLDARGLDLLGHFSAAAHVQPEDCL